MEKKEILINKDVISLNKILIIKSLCISILILLIITLIFGEFEASYQNEQIINPESGYLVYNNFLLDKDYSGIEQRSLLIFGSPGEYAITTNIGEITADKLSVSNKIFNYYLPFIFIECLGFLILIFIISFILFKINHYYKIKLI